MPKRMRFLSVLKERTKSKYKHCSIIAQNGQEKRTQLSAASSPRRTASLSPPSFSRSRGSIIMSAKPCTLRQTERIPKTITVCRDKSNYSISRADDKDPKNGAYRKAKKRRKKRAKKAGWGEKRGETVSDSIHFELIKQTTR